MSWSRWTRRLHRWLSMAFTVGVVVNFIVLGGGRQPAPWMYLLALAPLAVLLLTGLYLFALPYAARWRGMRPVDG